ncbi:MAG: type I DNA topoisomerase [Alphaproteobacteria bacterium]|nr:type I DNA topoisomerase [Alphaproteobacteria bacterium]
MDVVIVESPAKAKTINKYLGNGFEVIASFGHIRDLPAKNGSVRPEEDFAMDWAIEPKDEKHIKAIASAASKADTVYLATDPDREGEAIAWHVVQELNRRGKLKNKTLKRVVFNEITKTAVSNAMKNPREIDMPLVDAYLARRALDYLVGFTISPVLWRKLPGSRSAGRVQSVALRLVCERENEIEEFKAQEYWTIDADLLTKHADLFTAHLSVLDGKKLGKFTLSNEIEAKAAQKKIENAVFDVGVIERKTVKRSPAPAFTTSTLQQEAARKLFFSAKKTMQLAQQLYEGVDIGGETVGLITYMRTDGIQMAQEAINEARAVIASDFGPRYLPEKPRYYKNNVKNAQEAHEAIRPTSLNRRPDQIARYLNKDMRALYELIYKRALASQMQNAEIDKMAVDCPSRDAQIVLRATGQTIAFDGFLKVYREDLDDGDEENSAILPTMTTGEHLEQKAVRPEQHFTQPPPRYSEASLVKKLEELGIGRPSTYASILSVLQERKYVRLEKRRFIPEDRGRIVTAFMENFFTRYVQYDFTADLENSLDDISADKLNWKDLLRTFWKDFDSTVKTVDPLTITDILNRLEESLSEHLFAAPEDRICPECGKEKDGRLSLKIGKFGAFIGCSNYPECRYTRPFGGQTTEESAPEEPDLKELGNDPETGNPVILRKGPYGWYVQLSKDAPKPKKGEKKEKASAAKRTSLPRSMNPTEMTLDQALALLALPRTLGVSPETNQEIQAGIGRFGPYLKIGSTYKSLTASDNVLTIDLPRALEVLSNVKEKTPPQEIGTHPEDGKPIIASSGRFGPYIKHGSVIASIPKAIRNENRLPTLEEAVALLAAKAGKNPKTAAKAKKPAAKKAPVKKTAAKKTAAKKTTKAKKS